MKKLNTLSIPENPRWRTSIKCFPVATLLLGVPCMAALIAATLSLFLSGATAASVLPAAINMPWSVLPPCLLNSSMSGTAIVSLPSMKTSGIFSFGTALSLTVFFMQLVNCETHNLSLLYMQIKQLLRRYYEVGTKEGPNLLGRFLSTIGI